METISQANEKYTCTYYEDNIKSSVIYDSHCHITYEILIVISGNITAVVENQKYELSANDLLIIPPLKYHNIYSENNMIYKRLTILFKDSFIPKEISQKFIENTSVNHAFSHNSLMFLTDSLIHTLKHHNTDEFVPLMDSIIIQIFYTLIGKRTSIKSGENNEQLQSIIKYIDDNIKKNITLDDISRAMFLSKSLICHFFKAEMKISVKQYILQKKMNLAAQELKNGNPATKIAEELGFKNYSNFYKVFKNIFGVSPSSF